LLALGDFPGDDATSVRVIPITAANAGPMTGRGTNAYLLPGARPTLIDAPDPSDAFVDRVAAALEAGQPAATLSQVLVTHFHHDHIDGVEALARRWPEATIAKFPLPDQDAKHAVTWTPLKDGQLVAAGDGTLWVLHTPGHAPDHVALLDMRSSILFCGDLLVNGGTVAIAPSAGGDLAQYMASLRRLLEDQPRRIYPGHGPPVDNPGALIRAYITHRLGREQQILDELAKAGGSEEELTARVYPEVGPELRGAARENLRAHLLKLKAEGRATEVDGAWGPRRD
jgi:glyoxylase-like metal-dependent hydrolase (beta-lactamase superfamily II)